MRIMRTDLPKASALGLLLLVGVAGAADVPYGVGSWPEKYGNHRARIRVPEKADAVWAHIPWRRRDAVPQDKDIIIVEASTGRAAENLVRVEVNREFGDIVFQPPVAPAEYHVYYMPYTVTPIPHAYVTQYNPPRAAASQPFLDRYGLKPEQVAEEKWKSFPQAEVLEIQARSEFDRLDPMEIIATAEEAKELLGKYPGRSCLLFPEDRKYPIRMTDDLPLRWIRKGPSDEFQGEALRGEFYVFQIGVYAAGQSIEGLDIDFSGLRSEQGGVIPAEAFLYFSLGGTDWLGRPFRKKFAVARGKIGALWFGVQIPQDVPVSKYQGTLRLRPNSGAEITVRVSLSVSNDVAKDHGDNDLWRLARLRWLDSSIGIDDEVVAPYTPLKAKGQTVECLGRQVRFGNTGLPESIVSNAREILASPMMMQIRTGGSDLTWKGNRTRIIKETPGAVTWESTSVSGPVSMRCLAKMECDGYINFRLTIRAVTQVDVEDIGLAIPIRREVATYMMGMSRKGGYRPKEWKWVWDVKRANNTLWIGEADAGLYCKLKGAEDVWDIAHLTRGEPQSWGNGGRGGCTVTEEGQGTVLVRAYSGPRSLKTGEEVEFAFGLLITPVKPLDPAHWSQRYYHIMAPPDAAVQAGASIINIHHGNELNPNINYPFLAANKLAAYVRDAHAKGVKVKVYYTVRELSNYVAEMWPLRSLGYEVFTDGPGGGHSWLHEHLGTHYAPAWHHSFGDGTVDAAIATTGLSRWHNYYLQGLGWLLRNVQIDGLYLDGIGYDREIMKRVRKVMDSRRPGSLIDFHSGNEFPFADMRLSPACKYMEHFPYINSLWFGEGYDYNESPDYWLVEVSGIPFGLFSEMLEGNGNPWRGMVYGMTARYYSGADPKHIWKLWDDFGIQQARMIGYWSPSCPVRTDNEAVLATAYCKKGKTLVSLASWAKERVECRLRIDWPALGLDAEKARLVAPAIPAFQPQASFSSSDAIPFEPGRGWLLVIED
jgi:hypothetical protein